MPTQTLLMTGGSRGLGRAAAADLLRHDPELHLVVTDRRSGLAAQLRAETGHTAISELGCDLSSLASIVAATEELEQRVRAGEWPPLQGILANAGLQFTTASQVSTDGFEATFAVNLLANVLLVRRLAPLLRAPARIVLTTSDTHFGDFRHNLGMVAGPRWSDVASLARPGHDRSGEIAYSSSKLGVIYFAHALARRLPAGVEVFSYNPGLVPGTGLARDRSLLQRVGWRAVLPLLSLTPIAVTVERAGQQLAAAQRDVIHADSGSYLNRGQPERSSAASYDHQREEALWASTTRLLANHL